MRWWRWMQYRVMNRRQKYLLSVISCPSRQSNRGQESAPGGRALRLNRTCAGGDYRSSRVVRLVVPKEVGGDKTCRVSLLAGGEQKSVPGLIFASGRQKRAVSRVAQATGKRGLTRRDGIGWRGQVLAQVSRKPERASTQV